MKTSNLAEANRLKWPVVTAFKARIDEAKASKENPKAAKLREAVAWRKELLAASRNDEDDEHQHSEHDTLLSELREILGHRRARP